MTSNPAIFEKAILGSDDYDDDARGAMAKEGLDAKEIYDAHRDHGRADRPPTCCARCGRSTTTPTASSRSRSQPELARDTDGHARARRARYWERVDRPNVLIKIPGTDEGVPAIEEAIYEGINVNVTLLFAVEAYEKVAEAYIRGLERRLDEGKALDVHSVASFFVSRVDTEVDKRLEAPGNPELQGTAAVANARAAYQRFKEIFAGERWDKLAPRAAPRAAPAVGLDRREEPALSETKYVDELVAPAHGQHDADGRRCSPRPSAAR